MHGHTLSNSSHGNAAGAVAEFLTQAGDPVKDSEWAAMSSPVNAGYPHQSAAQQHKLEVSVFLVVLNIAKVQISGVVLQSSVNHHPEGCHELSCERILTDLQKNNSLCL